MLNELHGEQESDETVSATEISVSVETYSDAGDETVQRTYRFSYAKEWDKWTFCEFEELRDDSRSRHIMWHDVNDTPTIDVPPEVADKLAEATGTDEVVIQIPAAAANEYEEVYES